MILSHEHRFIFIHVHKAAGTSITRALLPFSADAVGGILRRLKKKPSAAKPPPTPIPPNITASELIEKMGPDRFRSYFSFAFVRNPWDWTASEYEYIRRSPDHAAHEIVTKLGSFPAFVHWHCHERRILQESFVCDDEGKQLVDFIGRYERLEEDFRQVCTRIGIEAKLPHLNQSQRRPYPEYFDPETRELVARAYAADITRFGYRFDDTP